MASALRLCRLPAAIRGAVERALRDPGECEGAIDAIEDHMAAGARTPDLLITLAAITFREAEALVVSQLEAASEQAIVLIDEAIARGAAATTEIEALKACCLMAIAQERAREAKLVKQLAKGRARERDALELAHRLLRRGEDDDLAVALLRTGS